MAAVKGRAAARSSGLERACTATGRMQGFVVIPVLGVLMLMALLALSTAEQSLLHLRISRIQIQRLQAQEQADSLLARSVARLSAGQAASAVQTQDMPAQCSVTITALDASALGLAANFSSWRIYRVQAHSSLGQAKATAAALLSLDPSPTLLNWRHFEED